MQRSRNTVFHSPDQYPAGLVFKSEAGPDACVRRACTLHGGGDHSWHAYGCNMRLVCTGWAVCACLAFGGKPSVAWLVQALWWFVVTEVGGSRESERGSSTRGLRATRMVRDVCTHRSECPYHLWWPMSYSGLSFPMSAQQRLYVSHSCWLELLRPRHSQQRATVAASHGDDRPSAPSNDQLRPSGKDQHAHGAGNGSGGGPRKGTR
jgi:hypothetical protein